MGSEYCYRNQKMVFALLIREPTREGKAHIGISEDWSYMDVTGSEKNPSH